jgi:hypothetical protein
MVHTEKRTITMANQTRAQNIRDNGFFRKVKGTYVYKRISRTSVRLLGMDQDYVWGVCHNGNTTYVKPSDIVVKVNARDALSAWGRVEPEEQAVEPEEQAVELEEQAMVGIIKRPAQLTASMVPVTGKCIVGGVQLIRMDTAFYDCIPKHNVLPFFNTKTGCVSDLSPDHPVRMWGTGRYNFGRIPERTFFLDTKGNLSVKIGPTTAMRLEGVLDKYFYPAKFTSFQMVKVNIDAEVFGS